MPASSSQIIVLAIPAFALLIAFEYAWGLARGRNSYRLADTINSLSLGLLSQISGVLTGLLRVGIYILVYQAAYRVTYQAAPGAAFWHTGWGWLAALAAYDFFYYWQHRLSHTMAVLWAAHVAHHQSQHYNLSTALRQPSTGALLGWVFYLPLALAGVPPALFVAVGLIDLLYQYWIHTEHVPRLGVFDHIFASPSNHRVHHAVNDRCLDKNYGGILILWDRLFGTFEEERDDDPCVYGTRKPLNSWDPLWANAEVYWALLQDSLRTRRWADKLRLWLKPPGWRPADLPPYPTDFAAAAARRQPPTAHGPMQAAAALQFAVLLAGAMVFLWHAEQRPLMQTAPWLAALTAGFWAAGALLQGRIGMLELLAIDIGAITAGAGAAGMLPLYHATKPLVLAVAIIFVALRALQKRAGGQFDHDLRKADSGRPSFLRRCRSHTLVCVNPSDAILLAALAASLIGDVALLRPSGFVPGLCAFLLGHLAYIALFKRGVPWFASRAGLAAVLCFGVAAYAGLWPFLPAALRAPVAAYVLVIALMAAQAFGRAAVLRTPDARRVAAGAVLFMASDTLLAIDEFARPLPLALLWILSAYFAAQLLIARWARPAGGVL